MLTDKKIPIVSFVGFSGSGKTTLMTKVILAFKQKGFRVATIKHDAHRFEIDHQGKDTWKYSQAGSDVVIINSLEKVAMVEHLQKPVSFSELVAKINNVDIIFVEGYKHESPEKILLVRREEDLELLNELGNVIAIASSLPLHNCAYTTFDIDNEKGIVEMIQSKYLGESQL